MAPSDLVILEPPYHDAVPILGRLPCLGAVATASISSARGLSGEFATLLDRAPWTMPCVVLTPAAVSPTLLQSFLGLPGQPAFVVTKEPSDRILPSALLAAIHARPTPPPALLIAYLIRRTRSVVLGQTLDQVWSAPNRQPSPNADRTVRHRLHRLGALSRHDWIRIQRLVRVKVEGRNRTVEQQAQLVGTESRTLRSWVSRYLGVTMKTFRSLAGWEWILESALRQGGFQLEDPVQLPSMRHPMALTA